MKIPSLEIIKAIHKVCEFIESGIKNNNIEDATTILFYTTPITDKLNEFNTTVIDPLKKKDDDLENFELYIPASKQIKS